MNIWKVLKRFLKIILIYRCEHYNSLKHVCINEKNRLNAINVWNTLKRKRKGEYHDLYLKTDFFIS